MDLMQALAVVDSVADRADVLPERGQNLIDAMACSRDWGIERSELVDFWICLEDDHPVGRWQSANAQRNRIRHLVNDRRRAVKERQNPSHGDW